MLCERCKNEDATVHLTEIVKEVKSEIHLCETCAREIGLNSKISGYTISVSEMLTFLDTKDLNGNGDGLRCMTCGTTFLEYSRYGKLGCPECYTYLADELSNVIKAYHGDSSHSGKIPFNKVEHVDVVVMEDHPGPVKTETIDDLRYDLERAVEEERYEDAAVLREKIKSLGAGQV